MTRKEMILRLIQQLPDSVSHERIISCLAHLKTFGLDQDVASSHERTENEKLIEVFWKELEEKQSQLAKRESSKKITVVTAKKQILELIKGWDDDVTIGEVNYHLELLKEISIGMAQLDEGKGIGHDELFTQLLREDNAEDQDHLVPFGETKTPEHKKVHKPRNAKDRQGLHKTIKRIRKKA